MNPRLIPHILIMTLMFVGGLFYVFSQKVKNDPARITVNNQGEETVQLNAMEKQLVGKWYKMHSAIPTEVKDPKQLLNFFWSKNTLDREDTYFHLRYTSDGFRSYMNGQQPKATQHFKVDPTDSTLVVYDAKANEVRSYYKLTIVSENVHTLTRYEDKQKGHLGKSVDIFWRLVE